MIVLVLSFLIQAGKQKMLKDLLIANSIVIGRQRVFSVLLDKKAKFGAISPIDTKNLLFASDSLFQSAELVHFMLDVHKVRPETSFSVQMNTPIKHFRKPANVRKILNFARCMQNELVLKELLLKVYEPVRYEDFGLLERRS